MALDNRGIKASELDLILVTTVTPDTLFPATACRIQHMVGATNAFGFDLNAACSGFLYALTTAASLVAAGGVKRVGVVGVDIMSTIINLEDRATSVLFGDGAGAVIVERVEEGLGILDFEHKVDGSGGCFLYMPAGGSLKPATAETVAAKEHYIHQAGSEVFKNAVREMADNSKLLMDRNGFTGEQLKLFVPHQANIRIMDAAARRLELDPARMMVNIDRFANTTTATIPTALHQAFQEKRMAKGDLVALAAFGAGFTWGATLLRWAY
jgi:3-oxoacyl-[acyl-carrier-protein] synthase-3